jgi:quinol monooxygenase YgiN
VKEMIGLVAVFTAKPGLEKEVANACVRIAQQVREHEKDCLMYEPYVSVENPGIIVFMEKYSGTEALENHRQMPYYREIVPQIRAMLQEPPQVIVLHPLG